MKKTEQLLILCTSTWFLISCNQNATGEPGEAEAELIPDTLAEQTEQSSPVSIDAPAIYVKTDTSEIARILNETSYHEEEVWEGVDQETWMGLYADKPHFFLEETTVRAERVNDAMVDEDENTKTGWEISDTHPAESIILISGTDLKSGEVIRIHLDASEVLPGDTLQFVLEGKTFELFASGNFVDRDGYQSIEKYKLFLRGAKNDVQVTQLLVERDYFDDAMVNILFAGDLDRDHFPDFLLDNSDHYNVVNPTLYLSSGAADNTLIRIVGWHFSVGC